jgi:RecA/RadA recombinase|tara:strand:- start:4358 stop:5464 length:1107 start_codon:yes stop_codon:yes gene_type:complete
MKSSYDRAKANKKIKEMMERGTYYDVEKEEQTDFISLNVLSLNLLFSGRLNGGIPVGHISTIAAASQLGKSFVGMSAIKNAQRKGMQILIIDTEYAFKTSMAKSLGVDVSKEKLYVHQDNKIEDVKTFIANYFDDMSLEEKRNTFVVMDSWGTLFTTKMIEDAKVGKDVKDMTLTTKKNDLANLILGTRATWLIVNHIYANIGGFGDVIEIPGGSKLKFNSDCVVLGISRAKTKETVKKVDKTDKEKSKDEVSGHIISAKTYKSRYSKGESKLQYRIKNDGGLDPYYGILDDAVAGGFVKVHTGRPIKYSRAHIPDDKPVKEADVYNASFWKPIFLDTDIKLYFEEKFTFDTDTDILHEQDELDEMLG